MDRLAEAQHVTGRGPVQAIDDVDYAGLARAFGSQPSASRPGRLRDVLESVIPTLAGRHEPFLLEVLVEPDELFEP